MSNSSSLHDLLENLRSIVFELHELNGKIRGNSIFRNGFPFLGTFNSFEKNMKEGAVIMKKIQSYPKPDEVFQLEIDAVKDSFLSALKEYQKYIDSHNGAIEDLNKFIKTR